jgi:uncharacterized membrane protein
MLSDETARGLYFALWAFPDLRSRRGRGGVAVSVFLLPYVGNPFALFFLAMLVCTVLEYVASFVMEKLFGTVFWDHSDRPLNLQGGSACSTPSTGVSWGCC